MQAYVIAAAIVLAMVLAVRLKTSTFGPLRFFDLVIPILFLGLGQWEVLLGAPGPSAQAFPLLLLIVYCLAWIQKKAWVRYTGVGVFNFLLIYTGYGIFIAVITLALLAIDARHTWRAGVTAAGPLLAWIASAASLASFFYGYVFNPAADCYQFPYRNPAAYPWFMGLMFARFLGMKRAAAFPALLGIVVLILLGIVLCRSTLLAFRSGEPGRFVIVILTGYSLIYAAAAAIGRICLGLSAAMSSRNVTLLIPGFLGLYFYLLTRGSNRRKILVAGLLVAVLPNCIQRYHKEIEGFSAMKRAWKNCYRATENIAYCDASSGLQLYPRPEAIHLRDKLNFLKQNHMNLYASTRATEQRR